MTATTEANWAPLEARLSCDVKVIREFMWMYRRCEHRGRVLQAFDHAPLSFAASGWPLLPAIPARTG